MDTTRWASKLVGGILGREGGLLVKFTKFRNVAGSNAQVLLVTSTYILNLFCQK
jgi:hypothetical protein